MVCPFAAESLQGHGLLEESPQCGEAEGRISQLSSVLPGWKWSTERCTAPALQALPAAPTSVHH